jgi:hypothetical protein
MVIDKSKLYFYILIKNKVNFVNKTKYPKHRDLERGQLAIEAVLIVVLLLSLTIFASREIRNRNLIGKMVSGPWQNISGMMSTGNWQAPQSALDANLHPHVNTMTREGD